MNRRLHREYLLQKQNQQQEATIAHHKSILSHHMTTNKPLPHSIKPHATSILNEILYTTPNISHENKDLRPLITTSHKCSDTLKKFTKRLSLILNAKILKRGSLTKADLHDYMLRSMYNLLVIVNEVNKIPNAISFYEYPYGNGYSFSLSNVHMNNERVNGMYAYFMADMMDNSKEKNMVRNLFSRMFVLDGNYKSGKKRCKRSVLLASRNGLMCFRHYVNGVDKCEGFDMRLFEIVRGTIEGGEKEWVYKPYMNTTRKKE